MYVNIRAINLVTSNLNKVREFKEILEPKVKVNHITLEYPELRSDDPRKIVEEAVEKLAKNLKMPIVAEDSGLFITALNGFPGTCSAYIHKRIGLNGILKLMENVDNRECYYKSAVGYSEYGKKPISFLGEEKGSIAREIKGNYGFGHDPIFIPDGVDITYAEMKDVERSKKFRRTAIQQCLNF